MVTQLKYSLWPLGGLKKTKTPGSLYFNVQPKRTGQSSGKGQPCTRLLTIIIKVVVKIKSGCHGSKIYGWQQTRDIKKVPLFPKTPEDLRICDHCKQNSLENELYILFHCDQYNDLRKTLFIKINDWNTLFTNYNIHDKVCFLFNNTDSHISRLAANFIFQAFEDERNIVNSTVPSYLHFLKFGCLLLLF